MYSAVSVHDYEDEVSDQLQYQFERVAVRVGDVMGGTWGIIDSIIMDTIRFNREFDALRPIFWPYLERKHE